MDRRCTTLGAAAVEGGGPVATAIVVASAGLIASSAPASAQGGDVTFDAVFDPRYPNRYSQQYTIADEPLRWGDNLILRGLERLPVQL